MNPNGEIHPNELENADIIVSLWAIDNGLERLHTALGAIGTGIEGLRQRNRDAKG